VSFIDGQCCVFEGAVSMVFEGAGQFMPHGHEGTKVRRRQAFNVPAKTRYTPPYVSISFDNNHSPDFDTTGFADSRAAAVHPLSIATALDLSAAIH
jgi:hypothetical protein